MINKEFVVNIKEMLDNGISSIRTDDQLVSNFNLLTICDHFIKSVNNSIQNSLLTEKEELKTKISGLSIDLQNGKSFFEEHKHLLSEEENLRKEYAEKKAVNDKLEELKGMKEAIAKMNTSAIQNEIAIIENDNKKDFNDFLNLIDNANQQLDVVNSAFENNKSIQTLRKNHQSIKDGKLEMVSNLEEDILELKRYEKNQETFLGEKRNEYNLYLEKLKTIKNELQLLEENHPKNIEAWEKHFACNVDVWGALNNNSQMQGYINSQKSKIETLLKEFDDSIGKIIREQEKIELSEYIKPNFNK